MAMGQSIWPAVDVWLDNMGADQQIVCAQQRCMQMQNMRIRMLVRLSTSNAAVDEGADAETRHKRAPGRVNADRCSESYTDTC